MRTSLLASARAKRQAFLVVVFGALVLISFLGAVRVRRTAVELDVQASEFAFTSTRRQSLNVRLPMAYFRSLSPMARIVWPRSRHLSREISIDSHVSVERMGAEPGNILFEKVTLPAESTRIRIRNIAPRQYQLIIIGDRNRVKLELTVYGRLQCNHPSGDVCDFEDAAGITLFPTADTVRVEFEIADSLIHTWSARMIGAELDFAHLDHSKPDSMPLLRRVSTIRSGKVFFETLGGEEYELRALQRLDLEDAAGVIRQLGLGEDVIDLNFVGVVSGMKTGPGTRMRNLMPTLLQWVLARRTLVFLCSALVGLVALGNAVVTLLRVGGDRK